MARETFSKIQVNKVSIPLWFNSNITLQEKSYDWNGDVSIPLWFNSNDTIVSIFILILLLSLNSTLVQFKLGESIGTPSASSSVSIPLWFNSNPTMTTSLLEHCLCVSIPLWFNSN